MRTCFHVIILCWDSLQVIEYEHSQRKGNIIFPSGIPCLFHCQFGVLWEKHFDLYILEMYLFIYVRHYGKLQL
jgi:hypothetical protein